MSNIFISYGDTKFRKSLKRISKQARVIGIFNKIITYSPKDLPLYIKSSPLFSSPKGGGYWLWKPYIIKYTLEQLNEGDILYYIDAGCTLNVQSEEWKNFETLLNNYNAIVFQYRSNHNYQGWEHLCKNPQNNNPALRYWIKPLTKDYFCKYIGNDDFLDYNKIMGGIIIIKKTSSIPLFLSEWFNISLYHPELICDPFGIDLNRLPNTFNAHRHDQSIITPLIYKYKDNDLIKVLPETSESHRDISGIIASRTVVWSWSITDKIDFYFKRILRLMNLFPNKQPIY